MNFNFNDFAIFVLRESDDKTLHRRDEMSAKCFFLTAVYLDQTLPGRGEIPIILFILSFGQREEVRTGSLALPVLAS